jgi:hypothetical protein
VRLLRLASVALLIAFLGCGDDPPPIEECADPPTYTNEIRPLIIEAKFLGCHSAALTGEGRNGAPDTHNFDTYELAQPHLSAMATAITSGREPPPTLMPPIVVTAEERDLVRDWRDCSFPK